MKLLRALRLRYWTVLLLISKGYRPWMATTQSCSTIPFLAVADRFLYFPSKMGTFNMQRWTQKLAKDLEAKWGRGHPRCSAQRWLPWYKCVQWVLKQYMSKSCLQSEKKISLIYEHVKDRLSGGAILQEEKWKKKVHFQLWEKEVHCIRVSILMSVVPLH